MVHTIGKVNRMKRHFFVFFFGHKEKGRVVDEGSWRNQRVTLPKEPYTLWASFWNGRNSLPKNEHAQLVVALSFFDKLILWKLKCSQYKLYRNPTLVQQQDNTRKPSQLEHAANKLSTNVHLQPSRNPIRQKKQKTSQHKCKAQRQYPPSSVFHKTSTSS